MDLTQKYYANHVKKRYKASIKCSSHTFWLGVKGNSMLFSKYSKIPQGVITVIDPEMILMNNHSVISKRYRNNKLAFKQFIAAKYDAFLRSLNTQPNTFYLTNSCSYY
ncbi:S24 family peptidase [Xenorhabdus santafensis]|uniref:S24 family peptidase n=1 Tax=Xenorhabdus santafensis TaxID=2582833 RepID=UPI0034E01733